MAQLVKLSCSFSGPVILTAEDAGQAAREGAQREAICSVAFSLIDRGLRIVRGNGSGQKPKDIASEVWKTRQVHVTPARVLEILNELRTGRAFILPRSFSKSREKASFVRGPKSLCRSVDPLSNA